MRAPPIAITIVALDGFDPTAALFQLEPDPRTRLRRTRTMRTCGVAADWVVAASAGAAALSPPIWRSRCVQYVSVDGLKSRPCANAFAVCPLDFHSFTLSDHFFSVSVMPPENEAAAAAAEYVLHAADT
jgi:hypothetical protein